MCGENSCKMDLDENSNSGSRSGSVSPVSTAANPVTHFKTPAVPVRANLPSSSPPSPLVWGYLTFHVDNPTCASISVLQPFALTKLSFTIGRKGYPLPFEFYFF
jgi:hypothetical protein